MGALIPWLTKIDPNTVLWLLGALGGYVWSHLSKRHRATVEDIIGGAVRAILSEIADHVPTQIPLESWLAGARAYVLKPRGSQPPRIWVALGKLKIPQTPLTERIVAAAVERATSELADRIAAERRARAHAHDVTPTK